MIENEEKELTKLKAGDLHPCVFAKKELIPHFDIDDPQKKIGIWKHNGHKYVCTKSIKNLSTKVDRYCDVEFAQLCVFYKTYMEL